MIEEILDWNCATDILESRDPIYDKQYPIADDFSVFYDEFMDGGGVEYTANMIDVIRYLDHKKRFAHAVEWCSGPGFIGFTLLHKKLCEEITFVDQYIPSLSAIQKTLQVAGDQYDQRVKILQDLDCCRKDNAYDLIVANPPWYAHPLPGNSLARNRIAVDLAWAAHKNFFSKLPSMMAQDGICVLLESIYGSSPSTFQQDLADRNLKNKAVLRHTEVPYLYYLVIQLA